METVFDHAITDPEITNLGIIAPGISRKDYLAQASADKKMFDLTCLYALRRNVDMAFRYYELINERSTYHVGILSILERF